MMNQEELAQWFDANKTLLETAYLRQQPEPAVTIDSYLATIGFTVKNVKVGVLDGMEQTRIAVIAKDFEM